MKKKSIILTVVIALSLVQGCGNTTQAEKQQKEESQNYFMEFIDEYKSIEEWRDTETGVHYFIYNKKDGYGGMGGICPRYNADGTLYVD